MTNETVVFVPQLSVGGLPSGLDQYNYPQTSDSWQCGGCRIWYAPWVKQCNCQLPSWYPHIPVATPPYSTCVGSLQTDENKKWVLTNG